MREAGVILFPPLPPVDAAGWTYIGYGTACGAALGLVIRLSPHISEHFRDDRAPPAEAVLSPDDRSPRKDLALLAYPAIGALTGYWWAVPDSVVMGTYLALMGLFTAAVDFFYRFTRNSVAEPGQPSFPATDEEEEWGPWAGVGGLAMAALGLAMSLL